MMYRSLTVVLAGVFLGQTALAQEGRMPLPVEHGSPIYRDEILTIPNGTVIDEHGVAHYRNIRLASLGDNTFKVISAEEGLLAPTESVTVEVDATTGIAEVVVTGAKSSACVDILDPVVSRKGNEFTVVIAETAPPSDVCIMMLVYYESVFELDTADLDPGVYTVVVNGMEADFTL